MGFFDKFIKITEDDSPEVQQAVPISNNNQNVSHVQTSQTISINPASSPIVTPPPTTPQTEPDMELVKSFYQDLIDEKTVSGNYLELKKNAEALSTMGFSEQQRFQAALKIMQTAHPNVTKEDMVSSVDSYIKKIDEISSLGESQCEEKMKVIGTSRQNEMNQCDALIRQKEEKITHLENEINTLKSDILVQKAEIERLTQQQATDVANLCQERLVFRASIEYVKSSLTKDKNIINLIS